MLPLFLGSELPKEVGEDGCAGFSHHISSNLHIMVEHTGQKKVGHRTGCARLWVEGTKIDMFDTALDDSAGTHGTRLERDVKVTVYEPPGFQLFAGFADGDEFGMGKGRLLGFT